jgi:hypothetical protein
MIGGSANGSLDPVRIDHYTSRMKVVDITDIQRKENLLFYRREYYGLAVLEVMADSVVIPIEFVLEQTPFGTFSLHVTVVEDLDYPIIPVIAALKAHIGQLSASGSLP